MRTSRHNNSGADGNQLMEFGVLFWLLSRGISLDMASQQICPEPAGYRICYLIVK